MKIKFNAEIEVETNQYFDIEILDKLPVFTSECTTKKTYLIIIILRPMT